MRCTRKQMLAAMVPAGFGSMMLLLATKARALSNHIAMAKEEMNVAPCPSRVAVISDEITQDFEKARQIASRDFGLHWIELRTMWDKNIVDLNAKELEEPRRLLQEHCASPISPARSSGLNGPEFLGLTQDKSRTDFTCTYDLGNLERKPSFHFRHEGLLAWGS